MYTFEQVLHAHCLILVLTARFNALPLVEFAINTTINISIGFLFVYLLYNDTFSIPIDHSFVASSPSEAWYIITHIYQMASTIRENIIKAQAA